MSLPQVIVLGISGVTCGGKTTVASEINKILPNCKMFSQDDYYFGVEDPRHTWIPELNHINFDILSSLDMEKMTQDVQKYISEHAKTPMITNGYGDLTNVKEEIKNGYSSKGLQLDCYEELKQKNVLLLIVEGFCILNHKPLADMIDLKYFFTLSRDVCWERRQQRIYDPPDCLGYFDLCAWPEHLKQLEEVKQTVKNVIYIDEKIKDPVDQILQDILMFVRKKNVTN